MSGTRWSFEVPPDWYQLPGARDEADEVLDARVGIFALDTDAATRLRFALGNVNALARERGNRAHWAYVPEPPSGRVEGLLTLHMLRGLEGDASEYLRIAQTPADSALDVVHRTVETITLPVGPAVTLHEFVAEPAGGGVPDPGVERSLVAVFPDDSEVGYEFSLVAQNLAAFQDMVGYLTAIASTVHRVEEAA